MQPNATDATATADLQKRTHWNILEYAGAH
jgi:hypothetical protein